ncbi:hypothetical protein JW935_20530 [candidate division KSB1 bacterium]|nr:hypothetical protein [candidate division KSB1 bacterium]
MAEFQIKALENIVHKILEVLKELGQKIIEAVKYLGQISAFVEKILESITRGVNDIIQAQGEMEIYIRLANIKSREGLISMEQESIDDFRSDLNEDIGEIDARYSKIQDGLTSDADQRVSELDAHLLNLNDMFPEEMVTPYFEELSELLNDVYDDASDSYRERVGQMRNRIKKSRQVLLKFVGARKNFFEKINQYTLDVQPDKDQQFFIPLWLVETEDPKDGSIKRHAFLPFMQSPVADGDIDESSFVVKRDERLRQLQLVVENPEIKKTLFQSVEWSENFQLPIKLAEKVYNYLDANFKETGLLSTKKFIRQSIKKSQILSIKGKEDA